MNPQTILAITNFSASTDAVLSRAAQLAREHDATLELMVAPAGGELPCPDAARRLSHHASQLGQRHEIRVHTVNQPANCLQDLVDVARRADLVVMGANSERGLKSLFYGLPEERLLRAARRPVLAVRKAGASESPYGHLLVAVDLSDASRHLVAAAFTLGKSAKVELFHAISTSNERNLRFAEASEQTIKAYRLECVRHAQDRLCMLSDSTDARRNRLASAIGHGNPALQAVVQQQYCGAELIVVGKRPASAVSDFVFGSVSQRVPRYATSDVLVIPHGFRSGTRSLAGHRLAQAPPVTRRIRAGAPLSPG
ncbi:MAG: universal stress protein [Ramlibacter sp.]